MLEGNVEGSSEKIIIFTSNNFELCKLRLSSHIIKWVIPGIYVTQNNLEYETTVFVACILYTSMKQNISALFAY